MKYSKLLFCFAFFISFFACKNTSTKTNINTEAKKIKRILEQQEIDFQLTVEKPKNAEFDEIYELLQTENVLQDFIYAMNERIEFPGEVTIKVVECGEDNAFYNPEDASISICYEFLQHAIAMQDEENIPKREKLLHAAGFTFLHEMGHAIVDKLKIPITGKEENAVDELAMVILMSDTSDATYYAAIEGAMQFYRDALEEDLRKYPYYDTHAPSIERYYDMLSIIVGANPESAKEYVGKKDKFKLHPDRAETAEADYEQKLANWKKLLGKAWKQ